MGDSAIPSKPWPQADYYEADPGFEVYEWCPAPPGDTTTPPTQVHLHGVMSAGRFVVRFKGTRTIDALIDALTKHREGVWGKR